MIVSIPYEDNEDMSKSVRITGTSETQVFVAPYGYGPTPLKLRRIIIHNEAASTTTVSLFDHVTAGGVSDPAANGDSTSPLFRADIVADSQLVLDEKQLCFPHIGQGLAAVASQANVVITAVYREA